MFSICLIDIITKLIFDNAVGYRSVTVIKHVLEFNLVHNSGISYGWLAGKQVLILLMTFIAIGVLGYFFTKVDLKKKKLYTTSMVLLLAGALGNAIDRVTLGYVIDFIHFPFLGYLLKSLNFTCNLADIYLTAGIIILLIEIIIQEVRQAKMRRQNKQESNIIVKNDENK